MIFSFHENRFVKTYDPEFAFVMTNRKSND